MMKNNETLPDIEKLGHDEFNLDAEEQQRLQSEGELRVQQVRNICDKINGKSQIFNY